MSDFQIPAENLSPPSVPGYSSANDETLKTIIDPLVKAGQYLHKVAQDAAFVNMQADLLHAKEGANQKAIDLVQQGPGKGFDFITSEGIDDSGNPMPTRTIKLNPDFQTYLDGQQQALAEKYKAFPDIVKYAMESFTGTAVEVHKAAYQEATREAVENGKAGVDRALQYATQDAIKTGKTDLLDAFASNPIYSNFYHPEVLSTKVDQAKASASVGMLSKSLLQTVQEKGSAAALADLGQVRELSFGTLTPEERSQLSEQIREVDAGEQSLWSQKVISAVEKSHTDDNKTYDEAIKESMEAVPAFRAEQVQKDVSSFIENKQNMADNAMRSTVTSHAQESGWTETKNWFMDPKNKQFGMSGEGFQQELSYIDARINEDKAHGGRAGIAATIDHELHKVASDPDLSAEDKTSIFRQAFDPDGNGWKSPDGKIIKINGAQLDYLDSHRVNNDQSYSDYKGMIATWGQTDQMSEKPPMIPTEQAKVAQLLFDQEYRRLHEKGTVSHEDMQKTYDHIKGFYTDAAINKAIGRAFTLESAFGLIKWDDTGAVNDMQGKIQRGELKEMTGLPAFQQNLDQLRKGQLSLLVPVAKANGFSITDAGQGENGQQFFYDNKGRTIAYVQTSGGKYKWVFSHTEKEPASFSAWKDLQ